MDVDAAIQQGRYIQLDVTETLSTFMVNDMPDAARFLQLWVLSFRQPPKRRSESILSRVVACGECSPVLWAERKPDAAIRLEQLWDEVGKTFGVDILCGYAVQQLSQRGRRARFSEYLCRTLSRLFSVRSKTQF